MPKATAQPTDDRAVRRAAGDLTRGRLLSAAAALIAERGWGSVTTRGVAERAGVNPGLVHYHFGTMETLLREALVWRVAPEIERLAGELVDDRPIPESIRRVFDLLDRFDLESEAGVLLAEALLRASRDGRTAEAMGAVMASWSALLEPRLALAQERGVVRADIDPAALARVLAAVLDGFLIQRMADPATDPAVAAETLIRLLAPVPEDRP